MKRNDPVPFRSAAQEKIDLLAIFSHNHPKKGFWLDCFGRAMAVEHVSSLTFREEGHIAFFSCSTSGNETHPITNSFAKELSLRLKKLGIFSFFKGAYVGKARSEFSPSVGIDALRTSQGQFLLWNQGTTEDLSAFVDVGMKGEHVHKKGGFDQVIRRLVFLWDPPPDAPISSQTLP